MADSLTPDNKLAGDEAHSASPRAAKGVKQTLLAATACAASGAYVNAGRINLDGARQIGIMIDYDTHASSTTGRPAMYVMVSASEVAPAAGDDDWFILTVNDGSVTSTALGGAVPSGADYTATPNWGLVVQDKLLLTTRATTAGSDELRQAWTINVTPWRWMQIAYGEHGDTTNAGTLAIFYVLAE